MNQFTPQELQAIGVLISRADIKGSEAIMVANLQTKIVGLLKEAPVEEKKEEKK